MDATIDAVRSGAADVGCVPIENSVEGGVPATLDGLAAGDPLVVVAEVVIPVTFVLAVKPGVTLGDVRRVSTHSHAHAQVRGWLRAHLPEARYVPTTSTAASAQALADELAGRGARRLRGRRLRAPPPPAPSASTSSPSASRTAPAPRPASSCSPAPARPRVPAPTGDDKTSLVVFLREERPGALVEALEQFVTRGINLTRIESRPAGDALGRYCFSIDCDGHVADARVGEALMGLHRVSERVRFLGSYPRADGGHPVLGAGPTEDDFTAAQGWLDRLRTQGA